MFTVSNTRFLLTYFDTYPTLKATLCRRTHGVSLMVHSPGAPEQRTKIGPLLGYCCFQGARSYAFHSDHS